jgi:hypothetical protein
VWFIVSFIPALDTAYYIHTHKKRPLPIIGWSFQPWGLQPWALCVFLSSRVREWMEGGLDLGIEKSGGDGKRPERK